MNLAIRSGRSLGPSDLRCTIYEVRCTIYDLPMVGSRLYAIRTPGDLRGAALVNRRSYIVNRRS